MCQPGSAALFDPTEKYRWWLGRQWSDGSPMTFIMLNPSTADAFKDDPTIRRCIDFAIRHGCSGLLVVNLYAYCSTDPRKLWEVSDPVGSENDRWIDEAVDRAGFVVAAWGAHSGQDVRGDIVGTRIAKLLEKKCGGNRLFCLGKTKVGYPRHPLYVRGDQALIAWRPAPVGV